MDNNQKKSSKVGAVFGVIGAIVVAIGGYALWVNSPMHEGDFLGMKFQLPLESDEHFCRRRADGIFTYNANEYKKCKTEKATKSAAETEKTIRHNSLVNKMLNTFTESYDNKTVITTSQAECMANKVENVLTGSQIDRYLKGEIVANMIGYSKALNLLDQMTSCVGVRVSMQ